ncbi:hypothetical protein EDD16DRAFT_1642449 [Pisolithus croceorrhizus]|nr:hypothetical protein EDD16DRAFT_1642449 [Pisolithus croceorrhizus]
MGMVSTEVLLPLVSDLLTFLGFVLILPHRHGSLRVPGGCARLFRAGLDGAGEYMLVCVSSCLLPLLRGSHLAM